MKNIITSKKQLLTILARSQYKITYINVNTTRLLQFDPSFLYLIDGWPVSFYLFLKNFKPVQILAYRDYYQELFSYLNYSDFFLIGHNEEELNFIVENLRNLGLKICGFVNGYTDLEIIRQQIKKLNSVERVIFLIGKGQPLQEHCADYIEKYCNSQKIICVGGGLSQSFGFSENLSGSRVLTPIKRFWLNPKELLKRTIFSLPYLFKFFK